MEVFQNGGTPKPWVSIQKWSNFGWFGVLLHILGNLQMWRLSGTVRSYRSNQPHTSRSLSHSSSERWHGSRVSTVSLEPKHSMRCHENSACDRWILLTILLNCFQIVFFLVKRICAACEGSCFCNWTGIEVDPAQAAVHATRAELQAPRATRPKSPQCDFSRCWVFGGSVDAKCSSLPILNIGFKLGDVTYIYIYYTCIYIYYTYIYIYVYILLYIYIYYIYYIYM